MKRVRAGLADSVYHAAGRLPVLGRVIACEHGKFLNRVHAQVDADHAPRRAVAVVVDAKSIQTIVVLRRPAAGDGELRSKSPVPTPGSGFETQLRFDRVDSRLKSGQ